MSSPKYAKIVKDSDDAILEQRISANHLEYPKNSLVLIAIICAFQPVYYSHAINGLDWTNPINALLYVFGALATTLMLSQAYTVMVETTFWSRQRHFAEVAEKDEKSLRRLRLQISIGYALFFLNAAFFVVCTCLMAYIFRHTDSRASFLLSPTLTAALLWLIAQKNEDARQRRMRRHK